MLHVTYEHIVGFVLLPLTTSTSTALTATTASDVGGRGAPVFVDMHLFWDRLVVWGFVSCLKDTFSGGVWVVQGTCIFFGAETDWLFGVLHLVSKIHSQGCLGGSGDMRLFWGRNR